MSEMATPSAVDRILREYFEARERGEPVERAALIERHPEHARELARFFASEDRFDELASSLAATARGAPPPIDVPDHEIVGEIACGGMGVVYRARQQSVPREVALKVLHTARAGSHGDSEDVRRFRLEAETAASLDHPGIVPILSVGETAGVPWYSMALVEGEDLATRLASGPLPARIAARVVAEVATAVDHAHKHGVLHRDLKPANILLDAEDRPHVTDFGLAKLTSTERSRITLSGAVLGTPRYMAPEQARGGPDAASVAADVYSLGMVLYACLTGRPAFDGATPLETLRQVLDVEPAPPSRVAHHVPAELDAICIKCLEKDPARRYETAAELAADLRRFLDGLEVRARSYGLVQLQLRRVRRHPWRAVAALLAALLVAASVAASLMYARREHEHAVELASRERLQRRFVRARRLEQAFDEWREGNLELARRELAAVRALYDEEPPEFAWRHLRSLMTPPPGRALCAGVPAGDARAAVLVPATRHLLRLELDGRLGIWSLAGERAHALPHPLGGRYSRLDAAAGRARLVVLGDDGWTIEGLDLSGDAEPPARFTLERDAGTAARALAVSGTGAIVAVGDAAGRIEFFDAPSGRSLGSFTASPAGPIAMLALSRDGMACAFGVRESSEVHLLDRALGAVRWRQRVERLHERTIVFGDFDESLAVVQSPFASRLGILSARDGSPDARLVHGRSGIRSHAASPSGRLLLSRTSQGAVHGWDLAARRLLFRIPDFGDGPVAVTADESELRGVDSGGTLRAWRIAELLEPRPERGHAATVWQVAQSRDGRFAVSADRDFAVNVWSVEGDDGGSASLAAVASEQLGAGHRCGALSPDARYLAGGTAAGEVRIFRGAPIDGEAPFAPLASIDGGGRVLDLAFSDDGGYLAILRDGRLAIVSLAAGRSGLVTTARSSFELDTRRSRAFLWNMRFSPDERLLVASWKDRTLLLVDLDNERIAGTTPVESQETYALAFSPDSRLLATGHSDGRVRIWRVERSAADVSLAEHATVAHGAAGVWALAFSPDGGTLATGGDDGGIRLWDPAAGSAGGIALAHGALDGHAGGVKTLRFTADGEALISGGGADGAPGELFVWGAP